MEPRIGRGKSAERDALVRNTVAVALVALCVWGVCGGCSGPGDKPETLQEYMDEYNARMRKANSVPTVVGALERARKLMAKKDLSPKAYGELSVRNAVWSIAKARKREDWVLKELRESVALNRTALAEIRKARHLPAGMVQLDVGNEELEKLLSFQRDVRTLQWRVHHAALLRLAEGDAKEALDFVSDMLTLEKAFREAPSMVSQLRRVSLESLTNSLLLCTALSGGLEASQLDAVAARLKGAQVSLPWVLRRTLRFERAYTLNALDEMAAWDDKRVAKYLSDFYAHAKKMRDVLREEMPKLKKLTVKDFRERLPRERRAIAAYFQDVQQALDEPGARLPDKGMLEPLFTDPLSMPMGCGLYHRVLLEAAARRRAAVGLLRVLAFRARNGRLPRAGEITPQEDPFRPGERMVYKHDKKLNRVGVYSQGWDEAQAKKDDPHMIGYWLVVERTQAGRGGR